MADEKDVRAFPLSNRHLPEFIVRQFNGNSTPSEGRNGDVSPNIGVEELNSQPSHVLIFFVFILLEQ